MYNGPDNSLGGKSGSPVSEAKNCVKEDLASPSNCEKDDGNWVENEPAVPSAEIQLKDEYALARVLLSGTLDKGNNGLRVRQRELPIFPPMPMRVNVRIDAEAELRTVDNGPPNGGILLVDGVDGTTKRLKREFTLLKRTDQGPETEFLVDVRLDVLLVK